MATYEDIERVNKEMTLTPIKNKNYAEVPQKINASCFSIGCTEHTIDREE
jgi:hypothetical protein